MAKTKEELNELKKQCDDLSSKLNELNDDELDEISGGLCSPGAWQKLLEFLEQKAKEKKQEQEGQ